MEKIVIDIRSKIMYINKVACGHSVWINRRCLPAPERMPDIEVRTDEELTKVLIEL